ncbi:phosphatidylinositol N-acetylglucosaminyltransferase subunit Y-like [Choloepus didactylus]|uniref:phosphatidylinositol N-acetylglucosaminyltransferase subunit Y-like n=1 Tax=Choloepus didactylus TaxID=27675 RepID=UPI0018A10C3A|nr:phosphatidylinositol N-acetylglucosaminyltransferase subunit Y-like [Choloepus didactylus]
MFLSLPTLTVLIPLACLVGLCYSAPAEENFPQGCTGTASFHSLLLSITIPVMFFHLWTWMGIKLCRYN